MRVIVYNYFRGVRCVESYINTNQSATNSQPNRISKEENKNKRLFNYTQMREKLHTNGKFDDAFRALYLYDIQLFSSPPYSSKWKKKQRKNKRNDYFIWRTSSCYIDVCLLFIFLEVFLLSSVPFFLFSHWFSRGYLFFLLRCRFVRLWLEWRKLSHIY